MKFDIHNINGEVMFTAKIDCAEDAPRAQKLRNANLQWADQQWADLEWDDLEWTRADLRGPQWVRPK